MVEEAPKQQTQEEWEASRREHVQKNIAEAMARNDAVWLNLSGEKENDTLSTEGYCERKNDRYEIMAMDDQNGIKVVSIGIDRVNPSNFGYEARMEHAEVKTYNSGDEGYQDRLVRITSSGIRTNVFSSDVVESIDSALEELLFGEDGGESMLDGDFDEEK